MPIEKCSSHPLSKQPLFAGERDYPTWSKYKEQLIQPQDKAQGASGKSLERLQKPEIQVFCCRIPSFVYDGGCPVKFQPPCSLNTTCTMATQVGLQLCGPGKELIATKRGRISISLRMSPLIKFSIPGDHL